MLSLRLPEVRDGLDLRVEDLRVSYRERDRTVRAIYEDRDGTLWIGSLSGLYALRQSRLMRFTPANGLASRAACSASRKRSG